MFKICYVCVVQELKKRGAKDVVRVCEPTYKTDKLDLEGISVTVSSPLLCPLIKYLGYIALHNHVHPS